MAEATDAIEALRFAAESGGFDAMPTLIRVATDLYVGHASPTVEESRQFEEAEHQVLELPAFFNGRGRMADIEVGGDPNQGRHRVEAAALRGEPKSFDSIGGFGSGVDLSLIHI